MKKSKLMTGIGMLCLSAAFLASCNGYVKSNGHVVLTYNGKEYTAEELFGSQKTPAVAEAQFNAVYKVAVRNYFIDGDGKDLKGEVETATKVKVEGQKSTARSNADKNGTSYDTEWDKILKSNNVENESELYDKFEYEVQKEKFEDKFYDGNIDTLRSGGKLGDNEIKGYLKSRQPYHVKQILIKIAGGKDKDYTNCQITKDEAIKINKVITELAEGKSFAEVARNYSDDAATKTKGGDLGIMDRDTSFVNDFKLGLYMYESFFGSSTSKDDKDGMYKASSAKSELGLNSTTAETAGDYADKISKLDDKSSPNTTKSSELKLSQIPYEAALLLGEDGLTIDDPDGEAGHTINLKKGFAEIDYKSQNFGKVSNVPDNAIYYPRNVVFNKYFNRHNLMVITPNKVKMTKTVNTEDKENKIRFADDNYQGEVKDEYKNKEGFKNTIKKNNDVVTGYDNVLRDEKGRVIFVFRSGNGTGEGSYQGIHFVVIERSPFIGMEFKSNEGTTEEARKDYGVSLDEYYTNYYPGQEGGKHPSYKDETAKDTYVSYFKNMEKADLATRANDVKTKIKGYNPNLNTYIFEYLKKNGNLSFSEFAKKQGIESTITEWIDMKRETSKYDADKTWNDSWKAYYTELDMQNKIRDPKNVGDDTNKNFKYGVVTEYCAFKYSQLDGTKDIEMIERLFGNGGVFHE